MPTKTKIHVLRGFDPIARTLTVYDSENFGGCNNRRVIRENIFRAIVYSGLILTLAILACFNCRWCFLPGIEWSERAFHLAMMLVLVQQLVIFSSTTKQSRQIVDFVKQLQHTVDSRFSQPHDIYEETEQRYTRYLDNISKAFVGSICMMYAVPLSQPITFLIFKQPEPSEWVLPNGFIIPVVGYLDFFVFWCFLLTVSVVYCLIVFRTVMYFIGMGFYVSAMVDDLAAALDDLDKRLNNQTTEKMARMGRKQVLADEIRFHNEIIDLANVFGDSTSELIFYQMLFSAIDLATFIFAIDETKGMSPSNCTAFEGALTVLVPSYIFCMLSENVTGRFADIGNAFYGCRWYYLSAQHQKMFLLPIQRAQKEFRLNGLGMVDCSLEIFARIIRTACSYFLILRSF